MENLRIIHTETIRETVKQLFCDANYFLTEDMRQAICQAEASETSDLGRKILGDMQDNLRIILSLRGSSLSPFARILAWP